MLTDSQHWDLLQTLFHLAEETPEGDRQRVLSAHCSDPALVQRALDIFHRSTTPATDPSPNPAPPAPIPFPRTRMGAYTLIRPLGSGGIGSVYLAERIVGATPQRVALKVLAPHAAGPAFIERFHREQHILGSLDHPNITRLIDAGVTDSDQPYLVMEYVDGEHFDTYCDHHNLSIPDRLRLFLHVSEAVIYAHRNLIVHLDLKPSNILVSHDGTVKLLDFGTSKLIQTGGLFTTTVMATPAYSSPEQLRNEPVTTACDIYSLGAILFELLTGRRPHANSSIAAMMERSLTDAPPESPLNALSAEAATHRSLTEPRIRQLLSGDLDTITQKCLAARPLDRYISVDALAQDITRYLNGQPVLARRQTTLYRLGKLLRRNQRLAAAAALTLILLIAALSYAELKQQKAIEQGRRAEQMETFMYSLFSIANSQYFGKPTMSVNDFLNLGVKTLPLYIHDHSDLRTAQISLAKSLWTNDDYTNSLRVFLDTARSAHAEGDLNAETESLAYAGDIAYRQGDLSEGANLTARALQLSTQPNIRPLVRVVAERCYSVNREVNGFPSDENIRLAQDAVRTAQKNQLATLDIADSFQDLGLLQLQRKSWNDAESSYRQALNLYSLDPAYTCTAAQVEGQLGVVDRARGDFPSSLAHHQHALAVISRCFGEDSFEAAYQEKDLAQDLIWLGRGPEALAVVQKSIALMRKEGRAEGPYMAKDLYLLANADLLTGHPADALAAVEEEIRISQGKFNPASRGYGIVNLIHAQALAANGREPEALPLAELADKAYNPLQPGDSFTDKAQAQQAHTLYTALHQKLNPSPN